MKEQIKIEDVPWLVRREIEALILKPFFDAFAAELGREKTLEIAGSVIDRLSREAGEDFARQHQDGLLAAVRDQLLSHNDAGDCDNRLQEETEDHVTVHTCDCEYVRMYERNGLQDLGYLLSCRRDVGYYDGMGEGVRLVRQGTRMEGCEVCDFRVEIKP
ncbi:MAG: L-2-amino-thiazoline-4-carboxylic acid hydrolase [Firmicutes bacterium]|nr:L-2-amino-thiazoline-4-carboxylic acid hydrolase [Bacillota bacterium]